jgi:hypothetical protein
VSVTEYLNKFIHLSRYAPDEVNTDPKRKERFLDGLIGPLNYLLQSHTFPNFQTLLNKAIGLENKRMELREQKRKFKSHGQSSNTCPASTHLRILSFTLVDQMQIILRIYSCNTQLNDLSILASRHHMVQAIIKIVQEHQ